MLNQVFMNHSFGDANGGASQFKNLLRQIYFLFYNLTFLLVTSHSSRQLRLYKLKLPI
jgi:hypothetical protein